MSLVKKNGNSGFSLIELITVVILLGILGVVAIGRFSGSSAIVARGFFDDTLSAVRFAQKFAISSGCAVRVVLTASGYELRRSNACTSGDFANIVDHPANRALGYQNNDIPDGFTLTPGTITFDALGTRTDAVFPGFQDFTVSEIAGTISYGLRVHQATGLVEALQ